jgi:catechol 2,3-dioxygenase-like lactoylglutathione lyase family enzyme
MKSRLLAGAICVLYVAMASLASAPSSNQVTSQAPNAIPALANTCLITKDVKRLAAFYAQALQMEPQWSGQDYTEFRTASATLALFAADAQERYIPGAAVAGQNQSAILEFRVSDVDHEYSRLRSVVKVWVKGPTTQPWGTRSIYFRDPDGNLVNFFTPRASR